MVDGQPTIIFLCIDCLRSDFLGTEHAETPFLDRLVETGIHYPNMYATATTTSPAVASFMTGRYSEQNGLYSLDDRINESVPTLAEQLSAAGYTTQALTTGPLVSETGLDRGFDDYTYRDKDQTLLGDWFETAVSTATGLDTPYFLYLHLWELHSPIQVPEAYDDPEFGRCSYARMLSALDRRLEAFMDALGTDPVVVVHGDHGESILYRHTRRQWFFKKLRRHLRYERGVDTRALERRVKRWFTRNPPIKDHFLEDAHGENVFDFVAEVPFLLSGPSLDPARNEAQVRQIDIFPTILDLIDGAPEDAERDGPRAETQQEAPAARSLLPPSSVTDRDAYLRACGASLLGEGNWQRAVRSDGWKYVEYPAQDWTYELYDLEQDPIELSPVENDRVADRLRARMPEQDEPIEPDLEIDELLRDLGYL